MADTKISRDSGSCPSLRLSQPLPVAGKIAVAVLAIAALGCILSAGLSWRWEAAFAFSNPLRFTLLGVGGGVLLLEMGGVSFYCLRREKKESSAFLGTEKRKTPPAPIFEAMLKASQAPKETDSGIAFEGFMAPHHLDEQFNFFDKSKVSPKKNCLSSAIWELPKQPQFCKGVYQNIGAFYPHLLGQRIVQGDAEEAPIGIRILNGVKKETFGSLQTGDKFDTLPTHKTACNVRNFQPDMIPYEENVPFAIDPENANTPYINASVIPDGYILAAGPNVVARTGQEDYDTTGDFLATLWAYDVSTIVMTTNPMEDMRLKCAQYWPDLGHVWVDSTEVPGTLSTHIWIATASETAGESEIVEINGQQKEIKIIRRTLFLSNGNDVRKVNHIQVDGWPDQSPLPPASFARLIQNVQECPHQEGKTLVHCSAGVGRTGTTTVALLIDELRSYALSEKISLTLDMKAFIEFLRTSHEYGRMHLIQRYPQYQVVETFLKSREGITFAEVTEEPKL